MDFGIRVWGSRFRFLGLGDFPRLLRRGCRLSGAPPHHPSVGGQIVFCNRLPLYRTSPDSSKNQYESRSWKRRFGPTLRAGGNLEFFVASLAALFPPPFRIGLNRLVLGALLVLALAGIRRLWWEPGILFGLCVGLFCLCRPGRVPLANQLPEEGRIVFRNCLPL